MAAFARHALWMELDAVDREVPVPQPLNRAVVRRGGDAEAFGDAPGRDGKRMVARRRERRGEAGEEADVFMAEDRNLAVHVKCQTFDLRS